MLHGLICGVTVQYPTREAVSADHVIDELAEVPIRARRGTGPIRIDDRLADLAEVGDENGQCDQLGSLTVVGPVAHLLTPAPIHVARMPRLRLERCMTPDKGRRCLGEP